MKEQGVSSARDEGEGSVKRASRGCTMVQNRKKHIKSSHPIIHFPTSEGVSEVSEQANE